MTISAEVVNSEEPVTPPAPRSVSFVRFILRFAEPGAVTVPGTPSRDDDAPWTRVRAHLRADTDPWDRAHLPGTSIAGALRDLIRVSEGSAAADRLFGRPLPEGTGGREVDAQASMIWVLGSRPIASDGTELTVTGSDIRASTAISRERAAAKENTLRVDEVLPAGTRFEIFLRWDDATETEITAMAGRLAGWQPLIGHGVSRGRGRCLVEHVRYGTLRLDDEQDLLRWLTLSGPDLARSVAVIDGRGADTNTPAGGGPLARVSLTVTGPVRVGSGEPPPRAGEHGQLVTPMFRVGDSYVLPGTGLKGLLRSRAEFVLRSVGAEPSPCTDQRCGRCWTCEVFGHAGGHDPDAPAVGKRAVVRIPDSVVEEPGIVRRQHVAIDRFTGGAQDGLLYTVDALESGAFDLIVEPLVTGLPENAIEEIRAILRLVFEDLNDGIAGIGAGVARGYGTVRIDLADAEQRGDLPDRQAARAVLRRMLAGRTRIGASL
jgi:CRISPR/Cas system CSM-associated protein Csm3 (group 7 of RAMP superfamily)